MFGREADRFSCRFVPHTEEQIESRPRITTTTRTTTTTTTVEGRDTLPISACVDIHAACWPRRGSRPARAVARFIVVLHIKWSCTSHPMVDNRQPGLLARTLLVCGFHQLF